MMRLARFVAIALAIAATAASVSVAAATETGRKAPVARKMPTAVVSARAPRQVTLPTGDRVLADPVRQMYTFRPRPGRERMSYRSLAVAGHQFVIPGDAEVPVASGRMSLQRFDVTVQLGEAPPLPAQREAADDVELTFIYRDRNGAASVDATTMLFLVDDPRVNRFVAAGPDGTATTRLPKGRYLVQSTIDTARPGHEFPSRSMLVNPQLVVGQDARVQVDARIARPVSVGVPDRAAVGLTVASTYAALLAGQPVTNTMGSPDTTTVFTAHQGPEAAGGTGEAMVSAYFARPGPDGTAKDSPVIYATAWHQRDRFFTGFRKQVSKTELATVRAQYGSVAAGRRAARTAVVHRPFSRVAFEFDSAPTPFTRIERYAGTVQWANALTDYAGSDDPAGRKDVTVQTQSPTTYRPGRRVVERWNLAPFGPDAQTFRQGDTIITEPALFGDRSGRVGISQYRRAHLALYRDGKSVGTSDQLERARFAVPPDKATYRLAVEAERDFTDLGSKTSATWTFRSAHRDRTPAKLPLPSVRYAPPVDPYGNVRAAGHKVAVPIHLDGGAAPRSLTVAVSYDGGTTWHQLPVHSTGNSRLVLIGHPARPVTVSLRAKATDAAGNTVVQTVVNAYRTGRQQSRSGVLASWTARTSLSRTRPAAVLTDSLRIICWAVPDTVCRPS